MKTRKSHKTTTRRVVTSLLLATVMIVTTLIVPLGLQNAQAAIAYTNLSATPITSAMLGAAQSVPAVNGQATQRRVVNGHPYIAAIQGTEGWASGGASFNSVDYRAAFDGSTSTYFDGYTRGHVQVEFHEPQFVAQIVYRGRQAADRLNGAILQGSNDGVNFDSLYTLDGVSTSANTTRNITNGLKCEKAYKYVRIIDLGALSDMLNIATIAFYSIDVNTPDAGIMDGITLPAKTYGPLTLADKYLFFNLTWQSKTPNIISNTGAVVWTGALPAEATLTASLDWNGTVFTKDINVTLADVIELVNADADALKLPGKTFRNLSFPVAGANGSTIAWTTNNAAISSEGIVTPAAEGAEIPVTVTATLTHSLAPGRSVVKQFPVIVTEFFYDAELDHNEWNTTENFFVNREDPHATFIAYDSEAAALANHTLYMENSAYYQTLNGDWKFHWAVNPAGRATEESIPGFNELAFNDSGWDTMIVPHSWQVSWDLDAPEKLYAKYDHVIYSNSTFPWRGYGNSTASGGSAAAPYYQDHQYGQAPKIFNPVGTYRKNFTVPQKWRDENRSITLRFEGVESNCYVWVNGRAVGYGEDSFTTKEFDITPFVNYGGNNVVTVQVFRWSSGSFFEDQDFLRISGIFRDVYLVGRAKVTLYDVDIITTPAIPDVYGEDWNLNVTSYIRSLEGATQAERDASTIEYKLYDADGYLVKDFKSGAVPFDIVRANDTFTNVNSRGKAVSKDYVGSEVNANMVVTRPRQWSAEKPYLYKLVVTLKQGDKLIETTCFRVGFRESKIVNVGNAVTTRWLINGSRILFYGTNAHETNPDGGRAMRSSACTIDYITRDIQIMKANNVNSLRMCHYPHDRRYYDLCDEYGLYIMEEANMENHDYTTLQSNNTICERFGPSLRDRQNNAYERTKNFASVVSFSMGNENNSAGTVYADWNTNWIKDRLRGTRSGYDQADPAGWVNWITDPLRRDYRPIHAQFRNTEADMYSSMYTSAGTPGSTSGWAGTSRDAGQNKPTVLCEYVHAMGNSNGNWDEYIAVFDYYPKTVGGFIWEWVDHSIWTPIPGNPTEKYMAYGGKWGEAARTYFNPGTSAAPHDGNFCNDGMIFPNREPRPQVEQMKYCYRMLTATLRNASTFTVTNKFLFTNANEYDQSWTLTENGAVIQSGKLNLSVGPAPSGVVTTTVTTADFAVPFVKPADVKPGAEYYFNVYFTDKYEHPWADAGHVISASQMRVTDFAEPNEVAAVATGPMSVDNGAAAVVVSGDDFEISISKTNGAITSYEFKGRSLLGTNPLAGQPAGPIPSFWRAPNDNEFGASGTLTALNSWRVVGRNRTTTVASIEVFESSLFTRVTVPGTFPDKASGSRYTTVYTIYPNGEVNINYTYVFPTLSSNQFAHEIGSTMTVNGAFNNLTWFGRGTETYSDRKTGSPIDLYQSTVEEQYTRYIQPIDTGNHVETRWVALTDNDGFGMIVKAAGSSAMPSGNSSAAGVRNLIEFNALYTTPEGLASNTEGAAPPARYNRVYYNVRWYDDICLRINYMNTGVGGDNSWGALPLSQYRVDCSNRTFNYSYTILPVAAFDIDDAMAYAQTTYSETLALVELVETCESEWPDGNVYLESAIAAAKAVLANAGSTRDAIANAYTGLYVKYVRSNWTAGISSPFTYSDAGVNVAYNVSLSQFYDGTNQISLTAQFDAGALEFVGSEVLFGGGKVTHEEYDPATGEYFARIMLLQQGELFTAPTKTDFLKLNFKVANEGADLVAFLTGTTVVAVIGDKEADTVECKLNPAATVTLYAPYDANKDGIITLEDISLIIYNFYGAIAGDSKWAAAQVYDVNRDGVIDIFDLMIIMTYIA